MPTIAQWQQALSNSYRIHIESSTDLCDDVSARQRNKARERGRQPASSKSLVPWPASGRWQTVDVRPIDILHQIGRITTPAVTELVDLSSTWAEIRYLWAFNPDRQIGRVPALRLSDAVRLLDFHQKTLLSDELGVGFAAYYMSRFERATNPVDVFIAKRNGQIRLRGNSRRSLPDYIFTGPLPNQYFIVECKGTQGHRSGAINQLARGTEQVVTVGLDSPAVTTHLVIGSWLNRAISILVIDPEEDSEPRILSRWSLKELSLFGGAKALTYVGDYGGAIRLLSGLVEDLPKIEFDERELDRRITQYGVFEGSTEIRRTPDGRELRMFRGLRSKLRTSIQPAAFDEKSTGGPDSKERPFILESDLTQDAALVRSISHEGTLLEVEVR